MPFTIWRNACYSQKDYAKAADYYQKAYAREPDFPDALAGLANSQLAANKFDEANASYQRLIP